MGQEYDKIIRENIAEVIASVADKLLGLPANLQMQPLSESLPLTLERRPDFLRKVITPPGEADYLLHVEFQTSNDRRMINRMLTYYALLNEKYELDTKQYVIYIGTNPTNMLTRLERTHTQHEFSLINMQEVNYQDMLAGAQRPEEVLFAILSDFQGEEAARVIEAILRKLKQLSTGQLMLQKHVGQLEILSSLRNLQQIIIKQSAAMGITYDIRNDVRYQQGIAQEKQLTIRKMLASGLLSEQQIADFARVPVEHVQRVREALGKKR